MNGKLKSLFQIVALVAIVAWWMYAGGNYLSPDMFGMSTLIMAALGVTGMKSAYKSERFAAVLLVIGVVVTVSSNQVLHFLLVGTAFLAVIMANSLRNPRPPNSARGWMAIIASIFAAITYVMYGAWLFAAVVWTIVYVTLPHWQLAAETAAA